MKTKSGKKNLIIIARTAEPSDMEFYNSVLRFDSHLLSKAVVIMLPNVAQFESFLETVPDDYSFSLLIHVGGFSMNPQMDGKVITDEVEKLSFYSRLKFAYTSRKGESMFNDRMVYHTQKLGKEEFRVEDLPLNRLNELKSVNGKPVRDLDFAVITALDGEENEIFRNHMPGNTRRDINLQTIRGKFEKSPHHLHDYEQDFLLVKQMQMGMVDAALSIAEIHHLYKPAYIIMGGVCGGRKSKVKMFDVIIPAKVMDFTFGSLEDGEFKTRDLDAKIDQNLLGFLAKPENKTRIKKGMINLVESHYSHWTQYVQDAELHFDAAMACGPWVVKTEDFLETYSAEKNNMIKALEMESYSVGRLGEIYTHGLNTLVVKSVMDYTDRKKEDSLNGQPVKRIAAYTSYLCIRAILPLLKEYDIIRPQNDTIF